MEHELRNCEAALFLPAGSSISAGSRREVEISPCTARGVRDNHSAFVVCVDICHVEVTSDKGCRSKVGTIGLIVGKDFKISG